MDLIVDGTDNFETRFLVNDAAGEAGHSVGLRRGVGSRGADDDDSAWRDARFRCLMAGCPPPGTTPTCDTAGILGPTVGVIASIEAIEAMKILSGNWAAISRSLTVVELWDGQIRQVDISRLREQTDCPTGKRGEFPGWPAGKAAAPPHAGRNAVQLSHPGMRLELDDSAERLKGVGEVNNRFCSA